MNLSTYRLCLQGLMLAAIAVGASPAVTAQGYPNKPFPLIGKTAILKAGRCEHSIKRDGNFFEARQLPAGRAIPA